MKDYYAILGVGEDAGPDEIAAAYRRQAFRWHPDRNAHRPREAHQRFLDLGEALTVLGNPVERRRYDRRRGVRRRHRGEGAKGPRPPARPPGAPGPAAGRRRAGAGAVAAQGDREAARRALRRERRITQVMMSLAAGEPALLWQRRLLLLLCVGLPLGAALAVAADARLRQRPFEALLVVSGALLAAGASWWWRKGLLPRRAARYRRVAETVVDRREDARDPAASRGGTPPTRIL